MKAIGGYPELELHRGEPYHKDALCLNTARNCLEYILLNKRYNKVYIPDYTCNSILEPFIKNNIPFERYSVGYDFEIESYPTIDEGEALLYTNYYGLKSSYVDDLKVKYGDRLIVDNAQAFYEFPVSGVDTFYSPRKFFGVPDGGYLYINGGKENHQKSFIQDDVSYTRISALVKRIDLTAEHGYHDFVMTEKELDMNPIRKMSKLTTALLSSIDYDSVKYRRIKNYVMLDRALRQNNRVGLSLTGGAVPLAYPYYDGRKQLREFLREQRIYVPCFWPNVTLKEKQFDEISLLDVLPLPINQNLDENQIKYMIEIINKSK